MTSALTSSVASADGAVWRGHVMVDISAARDACGMHGSERTTKTRPSVPSARSAGSAPAQAGIAGEVVGRVVKRRRSGAAMYPAEPVALLAAGLGSAGELPSRPRLGEGKAESGRDGADRPRCGGWHAEDLVCSRPAAARGSRAGCACPCDGSEDHVRTVSALRPGSSSWPAAVWYGPSSGGTGNGEPGREVLPPHPGASPFAVPVPGSAFHQGCSVRRGSRRCRGAGERGRNTPQHDPGLGIRGRPPDTPEWTVNGPARAAEALRGLPWTVMPWPRLRPTVPGAGRVAGPALLLCHGGVAGPTTRLLLDHRWGLAVPPCLS